MDDATPKSRTENATIVVNFDQIDTGNEGYIPVYENRQVGPPCESSKPLEMRLKTQIMTFSVPRGRERAFSRLTDGLKTSGR